MMPPAVSIRDVDITALTPRAELMVVARAALVVIVAVGAYLYGSSASREGTGGTAARNLLPYQALIQGHDATDQKMFRSLQVALLEAQNIRSAEGRWPDVEMMAEQGIDPFAFDPTNKGARYTWRTLRAGLLTNYLGIPDVADAPAWLLIAQEPDPTAPPEAYTNDEEHARLLDGTLLHVGIWRHASGSRVAPALVRLPQAEGWSQVFAVGPSASH